MVELLEAPAADQPQQQQNESEPQQQPVVRSNKSAELVRELRRRYLEEYEKHKYDDLYDEDDLKLIEDDWYVKRFLLARNRNVDAAFDMLVETMQKRNEMYISQIRDFHFPIEFYKIGALFPYEKDKNGTLVVYMRVRMHRKTVEMEEPTKGFLVHMFNKAEKLSKGQGFALVFDLTGAGYQNLDFPFLSFLIWFGKNHFPGSLVYILVYNLPWILSTFQKMVFAMLPAEAAGIIKFASGKEIFNYIEPENVPDYIEGGRCKRNYRAVAPGSKPIYDLVMVYGYSQADYDRIYPTFKKDLEEAEAALAKTQYIDPPEGFFDSIEGVEITPLPLPSKRVRVPKKRPAEETEEKAVAKKIREHQPRQELLSVCPSDHLNFVFDGKSYYADWDLRNLTDGFLAYKILSTHPLNYDVDPFKGILLPKAAVRIGIRFKSDSKSGLPSTLNKFQVVATPVKERDMSARAFAQIWKEKANEVVSQKVRCKIAFETTGEHDTSDGSMLSFTGATNTSDRLTRIEKRLNDLHVKYSRLQVMFYALLLLSLLCWSIIIAEFLDYEILKKASGRNLQFLKDSVCKMTGIKS